FDGFSSDDSWVHFADASIVCVEHPRHGLLIGVDVGSCDVTIYAHDREDLVHVPARESFELCLGVVSWVDTDRTFSAAVGDTDDRGFDGHPRGERHDLREVDVLVVTYAALCRATREAVLYAEAFKVLDASVVHFDRDAYNERAFWVLERLDIGREIAE